MALREVLDAFKPNGALSLMQLAKRLDIEQNTLEGMIQFWVHKGKLRIVEAQDCTACGVQHSCPLVVTLPRRYVLVTAPDEKIQCLGK